MVAGLQSFASRRCWALLDSETMLRQSWIPQHSFATHRECLCNSWKYLAVRDAVRRSRSLQASVNVIMCNAFHMVLIRRIMAGFKVASLAGAHSYPRAGPLSLSLENVVLVARLLWCPRSKY